MGDGAMPIVGAITATIPMTIVAMIPEVPLPPRPPLTSPHPHTDGEREREPTSSARDRITPIPPSATPPLVPAVLCGDAGSRIPCSGCIVWEGTIDLPNLPIPMVGHES